jgi:hypothetical protein
MSEPDDLTRAVAEVHDATHRLIRAAEIGDASMIDEAVTARALAVDRLAAAIDSRPDVRQQVLERVAGEAADAEAALRALGTRARGLLDAQSRGLAAARGYVGAASAPAALDRRG